MQGPGLPDPVQQPSLHLYRVQLVQAASVMASQLRHRAHAGLLGSLGQAAQHHRVIAFEDLFRGTLTQTAVYPREVALRALHFNAAAVILAHNHPSGVAEPSRADEMLTKTLKEGLNLLDIHVLDHFVVAGNEVVSFAERGLV